MKTAMQLLLKDVTEARDTSVDVNFRSALDFVRDTIEWYYIEMEKEQMVDAWSDGWLNDYEYDKDVKNSAEQYYNETFNTNEK
jgi:hypothetical protein